MCILPACDVAMAGQSRQVIRDANPRPHEACMARCLPACERARPPCPSAVATETLAWPGLTWVNGWPAASKEPNTPPREKPASCPLSLAPERARVALPIRGANGGRAREQPLPLASVVHSIPPRPYFLSACPRVGYFGGLHAMRKVRSSYRMQQGRSESAGDPAECGLYKGPSRAATTLLSFLSFIPQPIRLRSTSSTTTTIYSLPSSQDQPPST